MTNKPKLLDLFCGAGGSAVGYHRAGFEVVGVDLSPQKNYPFEFHQADAMTFDRSGFDVIHASPPCQGYSISNNAYRGGDHPMLVDDMRDLLEETGKPYVIENVVGAPMPNAITLCGASFGLTATDDDGSTLYLRRHRLFESNQMLFSLPCGCKAMKRKGYNCGGVYGGGSSNLSYARHERFGGYTPRGAVRKELMAIDWMTVKELSQAIPPAYTEYIGLQLLQHLSSAAPV
jgi:DNA (cytosine-5)-methyltransferase 1